MADTDEAERIALGQALMAEITGRLEDLAGLAPDQQLARTSNPRLLEGAMNVLDLIKTHGLLLPPTRRKPIREKPKA
ncbi:MAG: hypothetical protein Q8R82_20880 [Hyphomonadaceae bacterium]|nr:hypothetical protein [Hyphomonadaceae bacterium]